MQVGAFGAGAGPGAGTVLRNPRGKADASNPLISCNLGRAMLQLGRRGERPVQQQLGAVMIARCRRGRGRIVAAAADLVCRSSAGGHGRRRGCHRRRVELLRRIDAQLGRRRRRRHHAALDTVGGRIGRMMQMRRAGCAAVQRQRLRQLRMRPDDNRLYGELLGHLLQVAKALQVAASIEQAAGRIQLERRQTARRQPASAASSCSSCSCIGRRQLRRGGRGQGAAQVPRLVIVHAEALLVGAVRHAARTVLQLQAARHRRVRAQRYIRIGAVRGCGRGGAIRPTAAAAHARVVLVVLNAVRK